MEGTFGVAPQTKPRFYYVMNRLLRFLFSVVLDIDIRGLENVPQDGALVVAISHSSFLDPVLVGVITPRDVTPMGKIEAFDWPILGVAIRWYGAFPVRRGVADIAAFKTALKVLHKGQALVIAPEGHRSESGALQRGREGAIMLSLRTGAAILPVAVWGGKQFWRSLTRFRRTKMWYYVGKPVKPVLNGSKPTRDVVAQMSDELMARIAEMMPPDVRGYYADLSLVNTHHLQNYNPALARDSIPAKQKEVASR